MIFTPAICPQCGAQITNLKNDSKITTCKYCGTVLVIEDGLTNNSINEAKPADDIERTKQYYKIRIRRDKRFIGCAVDFVFQFEGVDYVLHNGGEIQIETNIKNINMRVLQQTTFGDSNPFVGCFKAVADGNSIELRIAMGSGFNTFTIKIVSSSNRTVSIK